MDCEQMRAKLDAYIDGELSAEEVRAIRDHAAACEDCRNELRAAELLRDALAHMDDDVAVPLEAQAAWRKAVRAEASRKSKRRFMRMACGLAAALVVVIGCTTVLRGGAKLEQGKLATEPAAGARMMENYALVASDGESDSVEAAQSVNAENYSAWKKYGVADFDKACQTLEALTAEYSGTAVSDNADEAMLGAREAMYRIELPAAYMEDFLNAAKLLGTELDSEMREEAGETAVIFIQLYEQNVE